VRAGFAKGRAAPVLDRYILRQLAVAVAIALGLMVFAIWLTQSLRFIEVLTQSDAGAGALLLLVGLAMPELMGNVLPFALAGSVLFTYGVLNGNSEVVVMRAAGLGPRGLARPVVAAALIGLAAHYAMNFYLIPIARTEFRAERAAIEAEVASAVLREGAFNRVGEGLTVYIGERTVGGTLHSILVQDSRDPTQTVTVVAAVGRLVSTETGPAMVLETGSFQTREPDQPYPEVLGFDSYTLGLTEDQGPAGTGFREPDQRFIQDLFFPPDADRLDDRTLAHLMAWGHQRVTTPLLGPAFMMIALGALLAGEQGRRGQAVRVIGALGGIIVIQALMIFGFSIARDSLAGVLVLYGAPVAGALGGVALLTRHGHRRRTPVPAAA